MITYICTYTNIVREQDCIRGLSEGIQEVEERKKMLENEKHCNYTSIHEYKITYFPVSC
jgi:hypothetical protein